MNNIIENVFYFGAPKDGFKVYPDLGAVSNRFKGYYTNTETDWMFIAKKSQGVTSYTYVKYGILTAPLEVEGRSGSCLGISIDILNHYFSDLNELRVNVIEKVYESFIAEGKLLIFNPTNNTTAFNSYNLSEVGPYLDEKSERIKKGILENRSNYLIVSSLVPDANGKAIVGLHPDSSKTVINEVFASNGCIKISPKMPVETKTTSDKREEERQSLSEKVQSLERELRETEKRNSEQSQQRQIEYSGMLQQKESEIMELQQRIDNIRSHHENFNREISRNWNVGATGNPQVADPSRYASSSSRQYTAYPESSKVIVGGPQAVREGKWSRKLPRISSRNARLGIGILLILLSILLIGFSLYRLVSSSVDSPSRPAVSPELPGRDSRPPETPSVDLVQFREEKGKRKGLLLAEAFLKRNEGAVISGESNLKDLIATSLFSSHQEIRDAYEGDKERFWQTAMGINPGNKKAITSFLAKNSPTKLHNDSEQQEMLKEFVVYVR